MKIHFTDADLACTRLAILGQVPESLFALDLLRRGAGGHAFSGWRNRVAADDRVRAALEIARSTTSMLEQYHIIQRSLQNAEGAERVTAEQKRLTRDVRAFFDTAVEPFWSRVRGRLEADRGARGRITLSGGLDLMLQTLHPKIRWKMPVLEIPGRDRPDIHLDGRGLVLTPSLFRFDKPATFVDRTPDGPQPVLAYPIPLDLAGVSGLWNDDGVNERALGALVGRTRTAVLRNLTESRSTGELGREIGISAAAVSQHTGVLRAAGLIATSRTTRGAQHTLTPLGSALLHG
ncbi:ArsR family transcriptional regulator [Amycolatopsis antarctica]|uniref:ArsR family transcriptional regulator n=1 Tax=Amycolatopsis antarctica TaxID=1854586 RepID=A0A263D5D7_9PSEU|nr:winged helix-turn-helix domain-containing protein [Amycolatopsis antarctica]OZM73591.1 ArsR family transcriptional regulator [Amycolatopsis antarctica]